MDFWTACIGADVCISKFFAPTPVLFAPALVRKMKGRVLASVLDSVSKSERLGEGAVDPGEEARSIETAARPRYDPKYEKNCSDEI